MLTDFLKNQMISLPYLINTKFHFTLNQYNRGYRGTSKINEIVIQTPKAFSKNQTKYKQKKLKKQFSRRAAIEPIIGHLKSYHRLGRNFYKGLVGDAINVMLSAAAFNFRRMMRKWASSFLQFLQRLFYLPDFIFFNQSLSY